MFDNPQHLSRRTAVKLAGGLGIGFLIGPAKSAETVSLFDGKTLDGWIQIENNSLSLASASIIDAAALVSKLLQGNDAISASLRKGMDDALRSDLASYSPSAPNAKTTISSLVKYLNQAIAGPPLTGPERPPGLQTAKANKLALERAYPAELQKSLDTGWLVKDGAMASTGAGRGVIYTLRDYARFRLMFTMRHVSGNPDHQACVLIFCSRPQGDERPLDALGGIQFQVPNGGHWDYRPGKNNAGNEYFTQPVKGRFDVHEWSRVEIIADASKGAARMAVAQPIGSKAVEVLDFRDPAAGRTGPIAWQMHNAGLFDEYKDVSLEVNPTVDGLITTG